VKFKLWDAKLFFALAFVCALSLPSCQPANKPSSDHSQANSQAGQEREPTLAAMPASKTDSEWQVLGSDTVTFTVDAPEAESARILYRPAFTEDRHVELKKLNTSAGKLSTQFKVPSDFTGEVWAEVKYAHGVTKKTQPISLTTEDASAAELADASYKHAEDSARSDKITGGHIEQTSLQPGNPNIRITVNTVAFQLTLWQDGKEVKTYRIGIGRNEFPLPTGLRYTNQIIFNPEWVPPDSSWVEDHDVVPGEHVEADDPRNPLGKVKVPLGGGILIHQASRPSELGHLVSHGCVRVLLPELYDLVQKIIDARSLKVTKQQLEHAKSSKDRLVIKLDSPLIVDITYDTQVVEGGVLHLYPDVYKQKTNTIDKVREELQSAGVTNVDDNALRDMLGRVSMTEEFAVSVADLKAGRLADTGQKLSLTADTPKKEGANKGKRKR
jgi:lipoprotein-anchoring transpeptidase ErfK/SrfK